MKNINVYILLIILVVILLITNSCDGRAGNIDLEFEKVVCESTDQVKLEYCYVTPIKRGIKSFSARAVFANLPVRNIKLRLKLMYNTNNVYKPFLYDVTVDLCKFLKNPYNPIAKLIINFISGRTNINHTCPFNHHLIVSNLTSLDVEERLMGLPFQRGRYALYTFWYIDNTTAAAVKFFVSMA